MFGFKKYVSNGTRCCPNMARKGLGKKSVSVGNHLQAYQSLNKLFSEKSLFLYYYNNYPKLFLKVSSLELIIDCKLAVCIEFIHREVSANDSTENRIYWKCLLRLFLKKRLMGQFHSLDFSSLDNFQRSSELFLESFKKS